MTVLRLLNKQFPENWKTHETLEEYVTLRVDKGVDDERALLEHMVRRFHDGTLPGVAHPSDPLKRLPYGPVHMQLLENDPAVAEARAALQEMRDAEAVEAKRERNRTQLAAARRRQAAQAEFRQSPLMYQELCAQRRALDALIKRVDALSTGTGLAVEFPPALPEFE